MSGMSNASAVAGTGRRSYGHYFRRPRSIGVRRAYLADHDTLRGAKFPPDAWADILIVARGIRSWKRYRHTQWRTV